NNLDACVLYMKCYVSLWFDDKPFLCSAPGCGQRFTNEDHLAVHEHKHEMTLKFGPARGNSVTVADPKPTPTLFLKYCEEVGLFNELTTAVDDINKVPLDLSPLATPMIIHNKIEDHSAVVAHWDSPLPHPESTTRDDKVTNLPSSLPSSTIVHPASLQVPNVLLATSDASVVIQQALPSPTSSSVITQASSSKRPIVPVSGTFPILFQLPNGQTMPVAIPATIASRVHIPIAIPVSIASLVLWSSIVYCIESTSLYPWFPQSHVSLSLVPPEPRLSVPGSPRATSLCPWFPQSHVSLSLVPPEPRLSVPGSPRATSLCPWFPQSHVSLSLVPPEPRLSVPGSPRATSLYPWFPQSHVSLSLVPPEPRLSIPGSPRATSLYPWFPQSHVSLSLVPPEPRLSRESRSSWSLII
uniref:Activating transcription factor 2 n=1 Tax=Oncorhynchus mykiss TaxID=8022 RepID=A0A8C7RI24_ONCMY